MYKECPGMTETVLLPGNRADLFSDQYNKKCVPASRLDRFASRPL